MNPDCFLRGVQTQFAGLTKSDQAKIRGAYPKLFDLAKSGKLNPESFKAALAQKYGLGSINDAKAKRLTELSEKSQKLGKGVQRNRVYQEMVRILDDSTDISYMDRNLLSDVWYSSVLARAGTLANVLVGSFGTGAAFTGLATLSTAVKDPALAMKLPGVFLSGTLQAAREAWQIAKTGDYSSLPDFERRAVERLSGKGRVDTLETLLRQGKLYPGVLAFTRRFMTAMDYIGAYGTRDMSVLYTALERGDQASLELAKRRFDKSESARAEKQAREELPGERESLIQLRKREILETGINQEILDAAEEMARRAAQNAEPKGIPGAFYNVTKNIPFMFKAPIGLAFMRAAMNMVSNASDWYPGLGLFTVGRSSPFITEKLNGLPKNHPARVFALDLPPEQRRLAMTAQVAGLGLMLGAAYMFLDEDEEKAIDISGSWIGITPQRAKELRALGVSPNSIKIGDKWVSYKQMPFAGPLAIIGHMRDQQQYGGQKWDDKSIAEKVFSSWLNGLAYVRDISAVAGLSYVFGANAGNTLESDIGDVNAFLSRTAGRFASGFVPSVIKEVDEFMDPTRYSPSKDEMLGHWLKNLPFIRRANKPEINFLGDEIVMTRPPSRSFVTFEKAEPVYELVGKWMGEGVFIPQAGKEALIADPVTRERRKMTDDEFYVYAKEFGGAYKKMIEQNLDRLDELDMVRVQAWIKAVHPAARARALRALRRS